MTERISVNIWMTSSFCAQDAGIASTGSPSAVVGCGRETSSEHQQLLAFEGLTSEPGAALLVVLHNDPDDEARVILFVKRRRLEHDT